MSYCSFYFTIAVKEGSPSDKELDSLSTKLCGDDWRILARILDFHEAQISGYDLENETLSEKACNMLMDWRSREGYEATYRQLIEALITMCSESGKTEKERNDLCKICFSLGSKYQGKRRMTSS